MRRILLPTLLAVGLFLLASENGFAQRGPRGPGKAGTAPPAAANSAPVNRAPTITDDRPQSHPFYGDNHGNENEWRYSYNGGRWWYWTPGSAWAYYNDGQWVDYGQSQPYTTFYRGSAPAAAVAPTGWYWSNDQHRWYWFDGSTLQPAQQ